MQSQQTLIFRQSLELGTELGQGEFGSVLKGVWTDPKGNKVKRNAVNHVTKVLQRCVLLP